MKCGRTWRKHRQSDNGSSQSQKSIFESLSKNVETKQISEKWLGHTKKPEMRKKLYHSDEHTQYTQTKEYLFFGESFESLCDRWYRN